MQLPTRIIDGLYLGDQGAAHDLEFLVTNKITKIINCAAKHIPNHWESIGIEYLSYQWLESETQFAFDYSRCFAFINDALEAGEAVLVHSIRAFNRSVFVVVVFLMRKFKWTLQKTLQYIQNLKTILKLNLMLFDNYSIMKSGFKCPSLVKTGMMPKMMMKYQQETPIQIASEHIQTSLRGKGNWCQKVQWKQDLVSQFIPPYQQIEFKSSAHPSLK